MLGLQLVRVCERVLKWGLFIDPSYIKRLVAFSIHYLFFSTYYVWQKRRLSFVGIVSHTTDAT